MVWLIGLVWFLRNVSPNFQIFKMIGFDIGIDVDVIQVTLGCFNLFKTLVTHVSSIVLKISLVDFL